MTESVVVIMVSVLLLAALALIFIYFFFKSSRAEVEEYYLNLIWKLCDRLDKIPNLAETVKNIIPDSAGFFAELADLRARTWPLKQVKGRVHNELEISSYLNKVWALSKQSQALEHDTNFLSLKTEFKEISREIEEMTQIYNGKVRAYNRLAGFVLLAPVTNLMRFGRMHIFEFEK